jgi:hypothetical protein
MAKLDMSTWAFIRCYWPVPLPKGLSGILTAPKDSYISNFVGSLVADARHDITALAAKVVDATFRPDVTPLFKRQEKINAPSVGVGFLLRISLVRCGVHLMLHRFLAAVAAASGNRRPSDRYVKSDRLLLFKSDPQIRSDHPPKGPSSIVGTVRIRTSA